MELNGIFVQPGEYGLEQQKRGVFPELAWVELPPCQSGNRGIVPEFR